MRPCATRHGAGHAAQWPHGVTLASGAELEARILQISDGVVRYECPFALDPIRSPLEAVEELRLGPVPATSGTDCLTMANSDVIWGTMEELTADDIVLKTAAMGRVRAPRRLAASLVRMGDEPQVLVAHDFSKDGMGDWKPLRGKWEIRDGAATLADRGSDLLAHAFEHEGPFTLEIELAEPVTTWPGIAVFAEEATRTNRVGLRAQVVNSGLMLYLGAELFAREPQARTLKPSRKVQMAWNPAFRQVGVSRDSAPALMHALPGSDGLPAKGYIVIDVRHEMRIRSIRVLSGITVPVMPADRSDDGASTLILENGDRMSLADMSLAEGVLSGTAGRTDLRIPLEKVRQIVFGSADTEAPEPAPNEFRVFSTAGRLTLSLTRMDEETLSGRSACAGDVSIARGSIGAIRRPSPAQ